MKEKTITIRASESKHVKPDKIFISLIIKTNGRLYSGVVNETNEQISNLKQELISVGYSGDNIKTKCYSVSKKMNYYKDNKGIFNKKVDEYQCIHKLEIELGFDLELLNMGIETISKGFIDPNLEISFTLEDRDAVDIEVLNSLSIKAKRKAEVMCNASGGTLGKLINVDYDSKNRNIYSKPMYDMRNTCQLTSPLLGREKTSDSPLQEISQLVIQPEDIIVTQEAVFEWEII